MKKKYEQHSMKNNIISVWPRRNWLQNGVSSQEIPCILYSTLNLQIRECRKTKNTTYTAFRLKSSSGRERSPYLTKPSGETYKLSSWSSCIDEFRVVLGGQPTPCFFSFFTTKFAKSNFLPCRSSSTFDGVERKPGLICLVRYIWSCWCRRVSQFLVTLDNG